MAAPVLEPSELALTAAPLEQARTLPGAAYHAPDVLAWELSAVFARGWVCVGRASDLAQPGDRRATLVGDQPVVITRDASGKLHALSNVCAVRTTRGSTAWTEASVVVHGCGPRPGSIAVTPSTGCWNCRLHSGVGGCSSALILRCRRSNRGCQGLDEVLSDHELDRVRPAVTHDYEVAANWKLLVENYHECYHCDEIHPELCRVSAPLSGYDLPASGAWRGGTMELLDAAQTMSLDGHSDGVPMRRLDAVARRTVYYVSVFPNLLLSVHPDYVMTHLLRPIAVDRTKVSCSWLFPPEIAGFDPAYAADFWDLTNRQDWAACEGVQRGVVGVGYRQGPFSGDERAVHLFAQQMANAYLRGSVASVLAEGTPSP